MHRTATRRRGPPCPEEQSHTVIACSRGDNKCHARTMRSIKAHTDSNSAHTPSLPLQNKQAIILIFKKSRLLSWFEVSIFMTPNNIITLLQKQFIGADQKTFLVADRVTTPIFRS